MLHAVPPGFSSPFSGVRVSRSGAHVLYVYDQRRVATVSIYGGDEDGKAERLDMRYLARMPEPGMKRMLEQQNRLVEPLLENRKLREIVLLCDGKPSIWSAAVSLCSFPKAYRDTLARAFFRLGRFDEALAEQHAALAQAPAEEQAQYRQYLQRLEADVAAWRDESGNLRRAEWTAKLDSLTHEIAELEQDRDVRLWLGKSR